MSALSTVISRGTRSAQPAASAVPVGSLYFVTDEYRMERSNGTTWDTFMVGGGLVLLGEQVASGSTSLDFLTRNKSGLTGAMFQSDFDDYLFEFLNVIPATNAVNLQVRFSTDGSTFDAGNNYRYTYNYSGSGAVNGHAESNSAAAAFLAGTLSNGSTAGLKGRLELANPLSAAVFKVGTFQFGILASDTNYYGLYGAIGYASATAVVGARFLASSGNLTSGTIRCYGVNKS